MSATIWKCTDDRVLNLLSEVRNAHHSDLDEARIVVLFREPAAKKGGKTTLGTMAKASAKDRALLGEEDVDYILTLSSEDWHPASERWRRALLDHELSHCLRVEKEDKDGDPIVAWGTRGHDIEEFNAVLERHGAWKDDIAETVRILKQLPLFSEAQSQGEWERETGAKIDKILADAGVPEDQIQRDVTLTAAHRPILEEAARKLRRKAAP
jgi:putative metallopeptidase